MQLVSQEILNPSYGLFLYADDDCCTVRLNPDSGINPVGSVFSDSDLRTFEHFTHTRYLLYHTTSIGCA